jgi:hypothetical protein
MAASFQSKDSLVLGVQLKVQELVVKKADAALVSVSGLDVTVDVKEPVKEVRSAIHCDDSVGLSLIAQAGIVISGSQMTLTLSNALADNDCIIVKYVINEQ